MKLKTILVASALMVCGFVSAQNYVAVDLKPGDVRRGYPDKVNTTEQMKALVEEYDKTRERHDLLIASLGPDKDWEADVAKAKAEGGHVIEAVIVPGENAEMCMMPADAAKVTHLRLTGRAYKWGE